MTATRSGSDRYPGLPVARWREPVARRLARRAAAADVASRLSLAAALVLALVAVLPELAAPGIVSTRAAGDSPFLLQRVHQMAVALADGHFPPRWMPDAAFGLGYPFWNYYAPLAWLVAGGLAALGGGVIGAIKVTTAIAFLAAAAGAWRLARDTWGGTAAPLLTSAAYTFAPYHLINTYVRGDALSELVAYAAVPWALVAIGAAARSPSLRAIVRLSVAVAAVLLSHNITALLAAPVLAAHAAFSTLAGRGRHGLLARSAGASSSLLAPPRSDPEPSRAPTGWRRAPWMLQVALERLEWRMWPWLRRAPSPAVVIAIGAVLGAALAAWFWIPALAERGYVQLAASTQGYFDFRNHFVGRDLIDWGTAFDHGAEDRAPARLGLLQLLLATGGLSAALVRPGRRREAFFWTSVGAVGIFMVTPASQAVWTAVPLLHYAQFPWRWLTLVGLATAMLAGPLAPAAARWSGLRWSGGPIALLGAAALAWSGMIGLDVEPLAVPGSEVRTEDLAFFEQLSGNLGSTVRSEYLPAAVVPAPRGSSITMYGTAPEPRAVEGSLMAAARLSKSTAYERWRVSVGDDRPASIAFPTYWFPGWTAAVDGDPPRAARARPGSGWLVVDVPPGEHTVKLDLMRSGWRAAAEVVALLALGAVAALWSLAAPARAALRLFAAALLIAISVLAARSMPTGSSIGPMGVDWSRAPYPHSRPDGIPFGDVVLSDARLEGPGAGLAGAARTVYPEIRAGETLRVSLDWTGEVEARRLMRIEAALVSPLAAVPDLAAPDVYARAEERPGRTGGLELEVPAEAPPGLYLVRLRARRADGAPVPATSPNGHPIGSYYLGPVRVTAGTFSAAGEGGVPLIEAAGLRLLDVDVRRYAGDAWSGDEIDGDQRTLLEVRMTWIADEAVSLDYKTSVRLVDPREGAGTVAQIDRVPQYGILPPTAWRPGAVIVERRWLEPPEEEDRPALEHHRLEIVLYEGHGDLREVGSARVELADSEELEAPR